MSNDPLIVALDIQSAREADALVEKIGAGAEFYKVGLELFSAVGPQYVRQLADAGKRVFVDLKFFDIGETVKRAVAAVARMGATFLTVHAVPQVMRAAAEGRADSGLKLLAVTVLTSFGDSDLAEMGQRGTVSELVAQRAAQAVECGMDGLIASPLEARSLRALTGPEMLIVTPGVRSQGSAAGDQKRVATPAEAIRHGADYLVVGRQVTRALDPAAEIAKIRAELRGPRIA